MFRGTKTTFSEAQLSKREPETIIKTIAFSLKTVGFGSFSFVECGERKHLFGDPNGEQLIELIARNRQHKRLITLVSSWFSSGESKNPEANVVQIDINDLELLSAIVHQPGWLFTYSHPSSEVDRE